MCGICGAWGGSTHNKASIARMAGRLQSRGPDANGHWNDSELNLALAHQRLAVLDLSPAGHQPMQSPCGRFVLVFNGEIYNHRTLRAELEAEGGGFEWRGHSDTETLLAGLRHWGIDEALQRLNGMFAFALWDRQERCLILARDRMGEKPLYYGHAGGTFLFGSELKALTAHPSWQGQIDRNALAAFMRDGNVPAPRSIYQGIHKLLPAHYVVVSEGGQRIGKPTCYWDLGGIAAKGSDSFLDANTLIDQLDHRLHEAVGLRMEADVPLGAFLSGGYDSSAIVAHMQVQSSRPVKTFSIGFTEADFNEAEHAAAVAKHLGTDHTELTVTPEAAMGVIPNLPTIYDEPFADSSQIPTYLVSQLARSQVTVSLSGDGGDELFAGYNRHVMAPKLWRQIHRLPRPMRQAAAASLALALRANFLTSSARIPQLGEKLEKLRDALLANDGMDFYRRLRAAWPNPDALVRGADDLGSMAGGSSTSSDALSLREQMILADMQNYLPDDILTKVDRASMAVSLEARVPMLDHHLVEFAWRVPDQFKVRDGQGKWLLRQMLYRYVPKELLDRPKAGFAVPVGEWLRGPLRDWAESLLSEDRLRREGFLNPTLVRRCWNAHLTGRRHGHAQIWNVLMFQAWLEENRQGQRIQ
ncbi:asparagine synthase (glutamine-hydrolyzing) [Spiribacter sp. C176]|uniref:asparagine synthase (glutamine-hydrolyzing) n=1 Tax=Spiribacter salilacus TaxID=2664894 RepID=A0A6N7R1V8_9GAMM|nr:asparagine synthase (glutamine-hydrolyzing) [Spiribacter salilacus]MRH79064.1 asparagine synthase (glutamine-hydrolyzing) [Spiribacter salilacus]